MTVNLSSKIIALASHSPYKRAFSLTHFLVRILLTNMGNTVRERVGTVVHRGMQEIGLKVNYELVEFGVLVSQITSSYDWEAMIIGFTGGSDPYIGISFWHSGENLHLWYPNQPEPATEWEAKIDELYIMAG